MTEIPLPQPPGLTPAKYTTPRLLWKTFLRRCDSTPAALSDVLYVGAGQSLCQLDTGGRTLWATETGNLQSSPVVDETRVYIGSDRSILYALNRRNGQILWRFVAGNTLLTAPGLGGGRVYAESTDNNVYAVDAGSGVLRWKFTRPDGSLGYSAPVYTRDSLYVGGESILYSLDPNTGTEQWHAVAGGKSLSTPATGGRRIFVGGDGSGLSAFSDAGKTLWNFTGRADSDWFGPPLYAAGTVYVTTYQRYVYAVDAITGRAKWVARILGPGLTTPILDAARGVVYASAQTFRNNPTLWAFDIRTGKELWNYRAGSINKAPALFEDRLYAGSLDGFLYAFALTPSR